MEGGIVVLVERDEETGRAPFGEVIFPLGAGAVLRGDRFFARGAAKGFELAAGFVDEHRDFYEFAAVENPVGGFAIAFGMVEIGGDGGGEFGALAEFDGIEKMAAGGPPGIFVANFHFVAGFAFEAEEKLDRLADVVAANFKRRCGCGRTLLRVQRTWEPHRENREARDGSEARDE